LAQSAQTLKTQMQGLPGIKNVQINAPLVKSGLQVKLLADEAARMGVTPQAVGNLLRIATVSDTDANAARFTFPDRQVPIRVVLEEKARNDLATLRRLQVATGSGGTVALENIATLHFGEGAASLERFDRERRIAVEADLATGTTIGDALAQVNALPLLQNLPDGVRMPDYGEGEYMNEMFAKFGAAMGFGILAVLMVLVLLFRDFLQPLTILIALPLGLAIVVFGTQGIQARLLARQFLFEDAATVGIAAAERAGGLRVQVDEGVVDEAGGSHAGGDGEQAHGGQPLPKRHFAGGLRHRKTSPRNAAP